MSSGLKLVWVVLIAAAIGSPPATGELVAEAAEEAADEAAPAVEAPADANAGGAANALKLRVVPQYISLQRSISFDQDGKRNSSNDSMSVNFHAFLAGDQMPLGYRNPQLIEAVTSAGETLKPDPNRHRSSHSNQINLNRNRNGNQQPAFNFGIQLPAPNLPALQIRELTGTVTLEYPDGPIRAIRLAPLSDYLGRPFRVLDMDNTIFEIKRNKQRGGNQPTIDFTHERSLRPLIKEVTFYNAKGVPIPNNENGWSGHNTAMTRYLMTDAPDDGTVLIQLYRSMRDEERRFVLRDIDLPGPTGRGGGARLALKTLPLDEAVIPKAGDEDEDAPELMRIERIE